MKSFYYYLTLLAGVFMGLGFSSCSEDLASLFEVSDGSASIKATPLSVDMGSLEVNVQSTGLVAGAYRIFDQEPEASEVTASMIFVKGKNFDLQNGSNKIRISGDLQSDTSYYVYLAFETETGDLFSQVCNFTFKTAAAKGDFEVFDITTDSFKVHVKVPESVKNGESVLKYAVATLFHDNDMLAQIGGHTAALNLNDEVYHNHITEDRTFTVNLENSVLQDENGNWIYTTDENGKEVPFEWYNGMLVPGEARIFFTGEFKYGEHDSGWGQGWYLPVFDFEAYYTESEIGPLSVPAPMSASSDMAGSWTYYDRESKYWDMAGGYYRAALVMLEQPEPMEAKMHVDYEKYLTPKGGNLLLTADPGVKQFCISVMDESSYAMIRRYFLATPDPDAYMQAFITSYDAFYWGLANTYIITKEPFEAMVDISTLAPITRNGKYRVMITAMGDTEGKTQSFTYADFPLPQPTDPEPTVVVTPLDKNPKTGEDPSPYEVWFNIKAPNKDVDVAYFFADSERAFAGALNPATYLDIAEGNKTSGNMLSSGIIPMINSDAGYDFMLQVQPDEQIMLMIYAENNEGTPNMSQLEYTGINPKESTAIAVNRSLPMPDAERVESDLFDLLEGTTWTASATVTWQSALEKDEQGNFVTKTNTEVLKSKVEIGKITYPETLTKNQLDLYAGLGEDEATTQALFNEFKQRADILNARTRGQNRILCNGFDFSGKKYVDSENYTYYRSAFDLFVSKDYSAYDVEGMFDDFGPKWYLEVSKDENGKDVLQVPFNIHMIDPVTSWSLSPHHLVGLSNTTQIYNWPCPYDGNTAITDRPDYFPVKIEGEGENMKLTIQSIERNYVEFFPNAPMQDSRSVNFSQWVMAGRIISEIVLTRGWDENTTDNSGFPKEEENRGDKIVQTIPVSVPGVASPMSVAPREKERSYVKTPIHKVAGREKISVNVITEERMAEIQQKMRERQANRR